MIKHECGVFGIYDHEEAARLAYFGLYAQQHRGQESAGIVSFDTDGVHEHKGMGLVPDVFTEATLKALKGKTAIGHVRYSTTGRSSSSNAQPFLAHFKGRDVVLAHNGNLVNAAQHNLAEITRKLDVDSLHYLSIDGLLGSVSKPQHYCMACFTGEYPVPCDDCAGKFSLESPCASR